MGFGLRAHAVVATACLAGCALIAGLDDSPGAPAPADAGADRVALDAAPCRPKEAPDTTLPVVARRDDDRPVTVDGDGAEWGCVDRWIFNGGDRRVDSISGSFASIAMQYDDDTLYLLATITTTSPSGTLPARSSPLNDSFHWFVVSPSPGTLYGLHDHHIVVDALDQTTDVAGDAGPRPSLGNIAGSASPVTPTSGGMQTFDVEMRITAGELGRSAFRSGEKIRMNFQLNDGPPVSGKPLPAYRIWFYDPLVCPSLSSCDVNGVGEPFCNPQCTQNVTLR